MEKQSAELSEDLHAEPEGELKELEDGGVEEGSTAESAAPDDEDEKYREFYRKIRSFAYDYVAKPFVVAFFAALGMSLGYSFYDALPSLRRKK